MKRLLVGLGNPLAGDDGFGPGVLEHLCAEGALPPDVEVLHASTDLLGLVDRLDRYRQVVLVDALAGGDGPPGEVEVVEEKRLLSWRTRSSHAHALSPVEALRVFRALAPEAPTRIALVALHAEEPGERAVHATAQAVREGARLVRALLR